VSILCYHSVNQEWTSNLAIPPLEFDKHCEWLARNRRILSLREAVEHLKDWRLPRRHAALTFDDGFEDLYASAFPVLLRYGLPATVFLIAERLTSPDESVHWVDDPPSWPLRTLSLDEVLEMQDAGILFGSHSLSHLDLTQLGEAECEKDLRTSREILEDSLGQRVRFVAYPRGRHNERVRRAAERAGFSHAFATFGDEEPFGRYAIPRAGLFRRNELVALRLKSSRWYLKARSIRTLDRAGRMARRFVPG
jgi:peptidoglycan/xylan/chitin deacetylase (PgdA/CDA1 family)